MHPSIVPLAAIFRLNTKLLLNCLEDLDEDRARSGLGLRARRRRGLAPPEVERGFFARQRRLMVALLFLLQATAPGPDSSYASPALRALVERAAVANALPPPALRAYAAKFQSELAMVKGLPWTGGGHRHRGPDRWRVPLGPGERLRAASGRLPAGNDRCAPADQRLSLQRLGSAQPVRARAQDVRQRQSGTHDADHGTANGTGGEDRVAAVFRPG